MQNRVHLSAIGWLLTAALIVTPILSTSPTRAQDTSPITAAVADKSSPLLHYQGRLTDADGEPLPDGNHTLVFKLYGQEEGGTPLWQETQNLETTDGVFSAQLGAVNAIDGVDFENTLYLGVEVNGGEELSPRTRLTSSPYAMFAESVGDSSITTLNLAPGAVTSSKIGDGEVGESELDGGAVTPDKIDSEAVTSQKIEDGAITSAKFDFGAVDSAAIDPDAVFKTLDPTLEVTPAEEFVGVNIAEPVTGSDVFSVYSDVDFDDTFGGMYVSVEGDESWPFYGYDTGAQGRAWHYFDPAAQEWVLEFDFVSPRHRLMATTAGLLPGGDGELDLGASDHRWDAVYAQNGTIQTSDRRLKTGIATLDYGLDEILELEPVSYRWKEGAGDSEADGESADRKIGLVAQQVREVIGEVVKQPQGEEGYLGMNYSELVPVLVRAVQQQQQIIERKNEQLRAKDRAMEARVEALEKQVQKLADAVEEGSQPSQRPVSTVSGE